MSLDFTIVDVVSDRPFGGNQLAVFPGARKGHGGLAEVSVGGHATIVGRGVMTLGAR